MTKKILIDARMYGLENAGIGRYLINLIEQLKRLDTKEKFIILLRNNYYTSLSFPENWKKVLADFGHYGFSEQLRLPRILNMEKPDLVHFPHLNVPIFWHGKFIVTVHDLIMQRQKTDATTLPLPLYYFKRIPFLFTSLHAVKKSQMIIVPTKYVASDLEDYYKIDRKKLAVIYEGFKTDNLNSELEDNKILLKYGIYKPYFFYVGNAYPHKNLDRAIEALVMFNKKSEIKTHLIIGGSRNVFTKRLNKEIKRLKATDLVKQIGYIKDDELNSVYKNSVGLIYPSLSEGFGLQGLEAISAGTLLLCSDLSVFKEIYGNNAIYFNPLDFTSMITAMKSSINLSQEDRSKFIQNGQNFIKKYSWEKMAKETLDVYRRLV